jgi:leucyl aminopeptidase
MLRAVVQSGEHKARLVLLEYRGDESADAKYTALVGKGVTFDTGGLLLKGRGFMEGMHCDKSGSAAVLAVMDALPQMGLKCNVVGALALAVTDCPIHYLFSPFPFTSFYFSLL